MDGFDYGDISTDEADDSPETQVYRYGDFIDRLEDQGALDANEMIDGGFGGVVYHHRGIRVPGHNATFVREEVGSREVPAFSLEVDAIGPRGAWAVFDATMGWDVYLLQSEDGIIIAWMSDEEYESEDAEFYASKEAAVADGNFSFGIFVYSGDAWGQRLEMIEDTDTPAVIPVEDSQFAVPKNEAEFYDYLDLTPGEFRIQNSTQAPEYLGLLEFELSIGV